MTERCKLNPCCGDHLDCNPPPQFRRGESWEDYSRRTEPAPALSGTSDAVRVKDWLLVAKAAGRNGIRYRTNTALEAFLTEISGVAKSEDRQDG